jgi:hypothetical protein
MGDMEFNGTPEEWDALVKKNKEQETLEEAIKREYETRKFNSDFPFDPQSFKLGAKWQQERMYSEEDMRKAYNQGIDDSFDMGFSSKDDTNFNAFIEQFKKK